MRSLSCLSYPYSFFFFNDTATTEIYTLSLHDALPISNADYKTGSTMTNAPIVIKDVVIAGVSGGEFGVRGYVTAFDVNTGKQLWRGGRKGGGEGGKENRAGGKKQTPTTGEKNRYTTRPPTP